tara:strand:+ start:7268 stop:8518 length:1251 start_codon:yes stop_codon:yes gene_type:complete
MRIGFMGCGKLGMPCALAIEDKGHEVKVYDVNPKVREILETKVLPYKEEGAQELLDNHGIDFVDIPELVEHSEIIFVPIQTPHDPNFEGITRIPHDRVDFDYAWLKSGIEKLSQEIAMQGKDKVVVIISTVLPGTIEREIKPLLGEHTKLCYNPYFIAMGTCIYDFLHPEFVLFGVDDPWAVVQARKFYDTIHNAPFYQTAVINAELIKIAYNTFIGTKIVFVNTLMEICHKIGADVDQVTNALKLADKRLISTAYMSGGMGDGGGCHPRDNIALSWLAGKLALSHDFFEDLMWAREDQTDWLRELIEEYGDAYKQWYILGKAFKPETTLTVGSPSVLLFNLLNERTYDSKVTHWDPYVDPPEAVEPGFDVAALYFIGTRHEVFQSYTFPEGSTVLDPFGYIEDQEGVEIVRIGRK